MLKKFKYFENDSYDIKREVDTYMYSITDEYQSTSEGDFSDYLGNGQLRILYKYIIVKESEFDNFVKILKRVLKVIRKEFNLTESVSISKYNYKNAFIGSHVNIKMGNIDTINIKGDLYGYIKTLDVSYCQFTIELLSNSKLNESESQEIPKLKDFTDSKFYFALGKRSFEESNYKKWNYIEQDKDLHFFDGEEHFATAFFIGKGYIIKHDGTIDNEWNRTDVNQMEKEVDEWMLSITDEYQSFSDEDSCGLYTGFQSERIFYIEYNNIILNKSNKEMLASKIKKISNILKRDYNLSTYISTKSDRLEMEYDNNVDRLKHYDNAIIKITFQKFL